ncbi:flagellar export protein FliJ [Brassicibacter mesophilus]|uniref:flagellar export protein FliJ n=1 Tax=Brassicibacter mesophilus TaxID=745119 RepID=UPI003D2039F3
MEKFTFRLEKVLDYKERVEDLNKAEYSKANKKLNEELVVLEDYISERKRLTNERNINVDSISINDLKSYNIYLNSMNSRIVNQQKVVEKTQKITENARKVLIQSTKEKKMLQKLKNRDYNDYQYLNKKEEEKITDQFVSYRSSIK